MEKQYELLQRCYGLANRSLCHCAHYGSTLNNVIETYNLTQYDTAPTSTSPMYRLYNRHTGEHLYTLNAGEKLSANCRLGI